MCVYVLCVVCVMLPPHSDALSQGVVCIYVCVMSCVCSLMYPRTHTNATQLNKLIRSRSMENLKGAHQDTEMFSHVQFGNNNKLSKKGVCAQVTFYVHTSYFLCSSHVSRHILWCFRTY